MDKKKLKVGFIGEAPYIIITKTPNGEIISGIFYDIWAYIKKVNNIEAEEIVIDKTVARNQKYDNLCQDINNNVYDLVISNFSITPYRKTIINYTRPVILNRIELGFKPRQTAKLNLFFSIFYKELLAPLIFLVIIGIIFGYILFYVDSKRGKRRAIFSTIASLIGEMGNISERSSLTMNGMLVAFVIMVFSYFFSLYLQAITVSDVLEARYDNVISKDNISNLKPVLVKKGYATMRILKLYKAKIKEVEFTQEEVKGKNYNDYFIEHYLKNRSEYCGFLLDYGNLIANKKQHGITITNANFGYDEIAFPINFKHSELRYTINKTIIEMKEKFLIKDMCEKYNIPSNSLSHCII